MLLVQQEQAEQIPSDFGISAVALHVAAGFIDVVDVDFVLGTAL